MRWSRVAALALAMGGCTAQLTPSPCLKLYSVDEVVDAVKREDVCTLVVMGDEHDEGYVAWATGGAWDALAAAACEDATVEVAAFHYLPLPPGYGGDELPDVDDYLDDLQYGVYKDFDYSQVPDELTGRVPDDLHKLAAREAYSPGYSPRVWIAGYDFGELRSIRGESLEALRRRYGESWYETEAIQACRRLQALHNQPVNSMYDHKPSEWHGVGKRSHRREDAF
jgi:hypothetical protein